MTQRREKLKIGKRKEGYLVVRGREARRAEDRKRRIRVSQTPRICAVELKGGERERKSLS
ncbi:(p)ppGpp syntheta [Sesbania bispinosa]|nr:(p)ppGpp syntheta [Sesbania bispinosa]